MAEKEEVYSASNIQVLEGLEAVRKRPAMYIGDISVKGLHHLVYEVVDNSIDEALAGYATHIEVTINADNSITVVDNGRGIPVDMHEKEHKSALEVVLTVLHAGGKFDKGSYKVSGGLHGVGVSCVNALSTYLRAEVHRDGKRYVQEYSCGKPTTELRIEGESDHTGTSITFLPDNSIFTVSVYDYNTLANRLRDLAYLNAGITLTLTDLRELDAEGKPKTETFYSKDGLKEFVKYIDSNKDPLIPDVIHLNTESQGIPVEVAITYNTTFNENVYSFVNNINTIEGGTHLTGFRGGLTFTLKKYAEDNKMLEKEKVEVSSDDFREGLTAVISVKVMEPQFEGQTKTKLGNTDAKGAVDEVFAAEVTRYLDKNIEVLKTILDNSIRSYSARKAGDKARGAVLKQLNDVDTKSKLASCSSKKPEECEVYIVEGDSAGGTVKTARNRKTQAVLPLRGKILNVEKATLDKILVNNEIKTMIASFGCGIGEDFDISKLRYGKIIILTDADVDGAHISTLLLTFFYRFMPELITNGRVYRGMPPLYKVEYEGNERGKKKKKSQYLFDDFELEKFRKTGKKILALQRYKGLGEMDASQLWETTLNPDTRILAQVSLSDTVEADEVTSLLMGSNVPPRRAFIVEEAKYAKLDF